MVFSEAITLVKSTLKTIGSDISADQYDGLIVKRLTESNVLDSSRPSTNQTHIAITGEQMDLFPYVRADGYFEVDYDKKDSGLKKYFVPQIPAFLHKENVKYLDDSKELFLGNDYLVHISVVRSRRRNAADQIEVSLLNSDSPEFVAYRKLIRAGDYIVLLKRKEQVVYDLYTVKESEGNDSLLQMNNQFYKLSTNTLVALDELLKEKRENRRTRDREPFQLEKSKESARAIINCIYGIDRFSRIYNLLENNGKTIKINTDELGGNYLSSVFAKPSSKAYKSISDKKTRVFVDTEYIFCFDDIEEKCLLSTEWMSKELNEDESSSNNYLLALISVVNKHYSDVLRIYDEDGQWYIEKLNTTFLLSELPDLFSNSYAKRFVTSLLAKPFVILTGNSGTGKTRLSKQFAEYLEMNLDEEKNWVLVPVGADWTDNTKVMGFYNPLADEGRGQYEKTEILRLIERANKYKDIPFFIILDEMNLSHVERYFADFLSHMETNNIPFVMDGYKGVLGYPPNVFVVGTVNIDETTYMFSPKVLDRANVIEFKPAEESVLDLFFNPVSANSLDPANDGTAESFMKLALRIRSNICNVDDNVLESTKALFEKVYRITEQYGFEFSYRTVREIRQYLAAAYELADDKESFDYIAAIDEQLLQKILPKIHGNRKEIGQLLEDLEALCNDNNLELSCEKIKKMKGKLATVQYASFI